MYFLAGLVGLVLNHQNSTWLAKPATCENNVIYTVCKQSQYTELHKIE